MFDESVDRFPVRQKRRRSRSPGIFCAVLLMFMAVSAFQSAQIDRLIDETRALRREFVELKIEHEEISGAYNL